MVKNATVRVRNDAASREVTRLWGNVPVVDATKDLRLFITPDDVACATKKDPGACVFAKACQRAYGSTKVLIYRRVAFVELPSTNGELKVERFIMHNEMRSLIEAFDKGEIIIPKAGFVLRAPPRSHTLDYSRNHRRRDLEHSNKVKLASKRRRLMGVSVEKGKQSSDPLHAIVRSGTGAVHFIPTKKKAETTK